MVLQLGSQKGNGNDLLEYTGLWCVMKYMSGSTLWKLVKYICKFVDHCYLNKSDRWVKIILTYFKLWYI